MSSPASRPSSSPVLLTALRNLPERLRAIAAIDLASLDTLPGGRWPPLVLAVLLATWFGAVHFSINDNALAIVSYGQPFQFAIISIYTESIPFMIAALALGLLGRTIGMLLVVLFAVLDVLSWLFLPRFSSQIGGTVTTVTVLGHFVMYAALWFLVVTIPRLQRQVHASIGARGLPIPLVGPVGSALTTALLAWLWTLPVTYMVRLYYNNGPVWQGSWQVQMNGWMIGIGAGVAALLVAIALQRRTLYWVSDRISLIGQALWRTPILGPVLRYAVGLALLAGFVTSALDVGLLLGGMVIADRVSPSLAASLRKSLPLPRVPLVLGIALGMLASAVASAVILTLWYSPALGSEFLPLIVAIVAGLVIVPLMVGLVSPPTGPGSDSFRLPSSAPPSVTTLLVALGTSSLLLLLLPSLVLADNCNGLIDCVTTFGAWLAANIAAIAAFIWAWLKGVFGQGRVTMALEPLASEEGAKAMQGQLSAWQTTVAESVFANDGDYDEYSRIKGLSTGEFAQEALTGKWDGVLGYTLASSGDDGGLSISGSAGH